MAAKKDPNFPSVAQLQAELEREKFKKRYRRTLRSTVSILLFVAAASVLLATLFFPVIRIDGTSMSPTLNEGEYAVFLKERYFGTGQIVVLSYNNKLLIKRIIAGPGQWVDIDVDGNVYVDGKLLDEPYLQEKAYGDCTIELPYQIPEERYFVLGDNRATSQDSRNAVIGCIPADRIIGSSFFRIWPVNNFEFLR